MNSCTSEPAIWKACRTGSFFPCEANLVFRHIKHMRAQRLGVVPPWQTHAHLIAVYWDHSARTIQEHFCPVKPDILPLAPGKVDSTAHNHELKLIRHVWLGFGCVCKCVTSLYQTEHRSYSSAWWIISVLTFHWKWLWQSDRQVERRKGNTCSEAQHSRNVRHGNCWREVAESSVANNIPWILWCPSNSFTVVGFTELTVTARKRFFSSLLTNIMENGCFLQTDNAVLEKSCHLQNNFLMLFWLCLLRKQSLMFVYFFGVVCIV